MFDSKYAYYKNEYFLTNEITDKALYKYFKHTESIDLRPNESATNRGPENKSNPLIKKNIIHGGTNNDEYKKYCRSGDIFLTCVNNFYNMRSLLDPYDPIRANLQAMWIRDRIGIEKIMKDIFIEKFGFNFEYADWSISAIYDYDYDIIRSINPNDKKIDKLEKKMNKYIKTLSEGIVTMVDFTIPQHANLHYVDMTNPKEKFVYIYDPHVTAEDLGESKNNMNVLYHHIDNDDDDTYRKNKQEKYWIIYALKKIYQDNGFEVRPIPDNILKQSSLPLCYVYIIHFFLYLFINTPVNYSIKSGIQLSSINEYHVFDDIYIMNFTRYLLKLCNQYELIDTPQYLILTNNNYKIQTYLTDKNIKIDNLFELTSSTSTIELLFKQEFSKNIQFGLLFFIKLKNDGYLYLSQLINYIIQKISLTFLQKCEINLIAKIFNLRLENSIKVNIKNILENMHEMNEDAKKNMTEMVNDRMGALVIDIGSIKQETENCKNNLEYKNLLLQTDSNNDTILIRSFKLQNPKIIKLLIDENNDLVNIPNKSGYTPLFEAIENKNPEIIKLLLEKDKTIVNNTDILSEAIKNNDLGTVKQLLLYDFDLNNADKYDKTPISYAIENKNPEIIKLLLEKDKTIVNNTDILSEAIKNNDLETVKQLLLYDFDLTNADKYDITPISYAIKNKNPEIIKLLLEKDKTIVNNTDILSEAIKNNDLETVKQLLLYDFDLNNADKYDKIPIFYAIENENPEIIKLLLEKDKTIANKVIDYGRTSIFYAIENKNPEIVKLLLQYGADVHIKNNSESTPLHQAILEENTNIIKLILDHDITTIYDKIPGGCNVLFISNNLEIIKILLEYKADLYSKCDSGLTFLNYSKYVLKDSNKELYDLVMTYTK